MLAVEEIHVWLIQLPDDGEYPAHLSPCIVSPEEAARAARFIFARDRARFIAAHAALRDILAQCTGQDAAALTIGVAEKGKPFLVEHPRVRFNLSHSGMLGNGGRRARSRSGCGRRAHPRRIVPPGDIAERFFAPAEVQELNATPEPLRVAAFFACWSRKEAYIKARGLGSRNSAR